MNALEQYLKSVSKTLDAHNAVLAIHTECLREIGILKAEVDALKKDVQFLRTEVLKKG